MEYVDIPNNKNITKPIKRPYKRLVRKSNKRMKLQRTKRSRSLPNINNRKINIKNKISSPEIKKITTIPKPQIKKMVNKVPIPQIKKMK